LINEGNPMIKKSILQQLSHARKSHLIWVEKANKIISSSNHNRDSISFDSTECGLGFWINQEGKRLRQISTLNKLIKNIEIRHNKLHNIYLNIYQMFFMIPRRKPLIQRLFNFNSNKENENKEINDAIELHLKDIEQNSEELLNLLNKLENSIKMASWNPTETKSKSNNIKKNN